MAKAYDRMEWPFLRRMMLALGFSVEWVNLVMLCVTTVSYNFLVNGSNAGQVIPTRGIRQGDLLSPYLFIICAEGLSLLLQQAETRGDFHGCRVARGAPPVSHLFFVDDSLLFFKANIQEAGAIKQSLTDYENMFGQAVNFHKYSVCFSRNTSVMDRDSVAAVLGVVQAPNFGKYLGLPSFVGRNKKAVFSYIEDKIKQRIGSWNKKLLSQAGKEVLLKSVAQSMPTFAMSVFLLPDSVCVAIERAMNRYWWGSRDGRGIHWKAWDKLCVPKKFGGLGFKDLRAFNLAMLGKQAWRFLTRPQSLVARIYKARYFPKTTFTDATLGTSASYCWRSIVASHELICSGIRRRVGNGKSTLIWGHPWLPDEPDPMVQTAMPHELEGSMVSGLLDPATGTWDHSIIHDIFEHDDVTRILKVPVAPHYEDSWFWQGDPRGIYSVKDGYKRIMGEYHTAPGNFDRWLHIWKIKCPAKWRIFLWRALSNVLPTTTNLIIKRVDIDPTCPMCGVMHENIMHSLLLCEFSTLVWNESSLHVPSVGGDEFGVWFANAVSMLTEEDVLNVVAVLYHIWRARNKAVWEGSLPRPKSVWRAARAATAAWRQVHSATTHHHLAQTTTAPEGVAAAAQCFVDAAFLPQTKAAAMGAVLLTQDGVFTAAFNRRLPSCFSPLMAESLACKEALSWLKDRGLTSVHIFTDCSTLTSLLTTSSTSPFSHVGFSVDASKAIMSSFINCSVSLIPRTANRGAHVLATMALSQSISLFWDSIPPDAISERF
ncbi:uncharacterized protein LOC116026879 [Ipomoea triloba]|uniref:uncharacterized protein LOC116026879 n=1 Tax=Ipomoea triloba TaxID=35885 RepID=UPI00125DB342|nr:uncharacterized protein LOC116026879 [Ipomoea triloba]